MIIVINKTTLETRQFSTLELACESFTFELTKGTLEKKKFPIELKEYRINKGILEKRKYSKPTYIEKMYAK